SAPARVSGPGIGEQAGELRSLLLRQLPLAPLDGADPRHAQVSACALDLANLGLDLAKIHRIAPEKRRDVQLRHAKLGVSLDRLPLKVHSEPLQFIHLRRRETKLLALAQHDADDRPLAERSTLLKVPWPAAAQRPELF